MEKMIYSIMEKMGSCINDSQWKIGAFLTNSYANPKKFRSRKNKIHFGLNQQPDCVVIPNPDRKSSVILEANRSQIPIASLLDSTIPWEFYKRITYPIPANDTIQFIYLFRHSITKTVILERQRIKAMHPSSRIRRFFSSSSSHSSLGEKRSATGSRIILFHPRRYMHHSELFLAVAPYLPEIAEQVIDAVEEIHTPTVEQIENQQTANEQIETTKNLIREEDFNKKLLDVERKRFERFAENECNTFLKSIDPIDLPLEIKRLEYELFLGNKDFYRECLRILGAKCPMLDEVHAHLVKNNIPGEESKLRNLLKYLLKRQGKEYSFKNLFILAKHMRNPNFIKLVILPLISDFNQGGWKE